MKKIALLVPLFGALLLTGCSDPKDPTAGNFKVALEKFHKNDGCQGFAFDSIFEVKWPLVVDARVNNYPALPRLEKLGLVASTKTVKNNRPALSYELTDLGKKVLKSPGVNTFCAYDLEVLSVEKWTEPLMSAGTTSVIVDYKAKPINVQAWSKLPEAKAFLLDGNSESLDLQRTMILTDTGWEVEY